MSPALSETSDEIERLRARLHLAEARLAEAQGIARIGHWERDVVHDWGWWSEELCTILGVPPGTKQPGFRDALDLVHAEDRQRVRQAYQATMSNAQPFVKEYRIVRPDGSVRIVHAIGKAKAGPDGAVTGVMGTLQDITERRQLERALIESEERYRSLFERVPLGIWVVASDRRFSKTNPAWTRLSGYAAEELERMDALDIVHPEDRAAAERIMAGTRAGDTDEFATDLRLVRKGGAVFWGRVSGSVLRDELGVLTHWIGIVEDITAQREAAQRRAERQRQLRDALVGEVHHRIKNSLQGAAGLLERHAELNSALKPALDEALGRLHALVMAHGMLGEQAGRELNLCNIARGVVDALREVSPVALEFALPGDFVPAALHADEAVPVALIVNELVSNAVKHADRSVGRPLVTVKMAREGARASVSVRSAPAFLPAGFDLDAGRFIGAGLRLAKSMLPAEGAALSVSAPASGLVDSVLTLWPPVLNPVHCQ